MDFPFGHKHHHRKDDDDEEAYRPPPPPQHTHHHQPHYPPPPDPFNPIGYQPPHPPSSYERFDSGPGYPEPGYPKPAYPRPGYPEPGYPEPSYPEPSYPEPTYPEPAYPRPSRPPVQHVSHNQGYEPDRPEFRHESQGYEPDRSEFRHESHLPHHGGHNILPSFIHHKTHESGGSSELDGLPTFRVYTKAEVNYSLTIRDDKVVLVRSDPSDEFQHWYKDMRFSTKVKDAEGFPSFALVNKATGQALKHSVGATHPVQLVPYRPGVLDQSVLWAESRDLGDTYRCIRMVNNIGLNLDAFNGDANHGGVHDGTIAVLWEWLKGDNQRWKISPY